MPGQLQWTHKRPTTAVPVCMKAAQCRPLHLTHGPALCSTSKGQQTTDTPKDGKNTKEDEEMYDGPEYIPRRKAKNPMMKIGYAWMIGLPCGILGFVLAKREVDKNRLKQLRVRQRMKRSNEGDYEGSRYQRHGDEGLELNR
uniref:Si:ch73-71c20.5 n=2 Tax=Gadus morhua TaxID=8049 RepID=A0A8C5AV75_GADMO